MSIGTKETRLIELEMGLEELLNIVKKVNSLSSGEHSIDEELAYSNVLSDRSVAVLKAISFNEMFPYAVEMGGHLFCDKWCHEWIISTYRKENKKKLKKKNMWDKGILDEVRSGGNDDSIDYNCHKCNALTEFMKGNINDKH